jgi:hypothetical protein
MGLAAASAHTNDRISPSLRINLLGNAGGCKALTVLRVAGYFIVDRHWIAEFVVDRDVFVMGRDSMSRRLLCNDLEYLY